MLASWVGSLIFIGLARISAPASTTGESRLTERAFPPYVSSAGQIAAHYPNLRRVVAMLAW